jgi:phosphatidylserine decarboxylase precursor
MTNPNVVCPAPQWWTAVQKAAAPQTGTHQINLSSCQMTADQGTEEEKKAIAMVSQLPSPIVDQLTREFEAKTCPGHPPPILSAASAVHYMKMINLHPPQLFYCQQQPELIKAWNNAKTETERDTIRAQCAFFYDNNFQSIFQRCLPSRDMVMPEQERQWIAFHLAPFLVARYDSLSWMEHEEMTLVSPCQSFVVSFPSTNDATRLWIKGRHYSVSSFLAGHPISFSSFHKRQYSESAKKEIATLIFRLTPRHYHRYHMPVTGRLLGMVFVPGKHWSVQPALLHQSQLDVLTENVRLLLFFKTRYFGVVAVCLVGATCVFSMELTHPFSQDIQSVLQTTLQKAIQQPRVFHRFPLASSVVFRKRQQLGYFRYGSTVVLLFAHSLQRSVRFSQHIQMASQERVETEVQVGHPLAVSMESFVSRSSSSSSSLLNDKKDNPLTRISPLFQLCG